MGIRREELEIRWREGKVGERGQEWRERRRGRKGEDRRRIRNARRVMINKVGREKREEEVQE